MAEKEQLCQGKRPQWRFVATILDHQKNNSLRYLGTFDTALDAARAYDDAARGLHGSEGKTDFPPDDDDPSEGDEAGRRPKKQQNSQQPLTLPFDLNKVPPPA